jgi:hypothetical protein
MAGPWEDFQTPEAVQDASAPWEDFRAKDESKPWEDFGKQFKKDELAKQTFQARLEGQQAKALQGIADIGSGAAYWVADALAKVDPTGISGQMLARQEVPRTPPILAPEDIDTMTEVIKRGLHIPETAPAEGKLGEVTRGLKEAGKEMAVGFSDPGMIAGLGLAKALPQEGARLFQLQMMGALPQTVDQAMQAQNLEEAVKGGVGVAANVAFPIALGGAAAGPSVKVPDFIGRQLEMQRGAPAPRQEPVAPIERVTPEQAKIAAERMSAPFDASMEYKGFNTPKVEPSGIPREPRSIREAWESFNKSETATPNELVLVAEKLMDEGNAPGSLRLPINIYKQAMEAGKDPELAEFRVLAMIEKIAKETPPEIPSGELKVKPPEPPKFSETTPLSERGESQPLTTTSNEQQRRNIPTQPSDRGTSGSESGIADSGRLSDSERSAAASSGLPESVGVIEGKTLGRVREIPPNAKTVNAPAFPERSFSVIKVPNPNPKYSHYEIWDSETGLGLGKDFSKLKEATSFVENNYNLNADQIVYNKTKGIFSPESIKYSVEQALKEQSKPSPPPAAASAEQGASKTAEAQVGRPTTPPAVEPARGEAGMGAIPKPSGFKEPPMPERFDTLQDAINYRESYKQAEIDFYKSLGLNDADANKMFRAGDSRSNLDVSKIEAKLSPENMERLDQFSTGEGSEMYQWDRQYDPSELAHNTDKGELALNLIQNISRESAPKSFGDKLIHASVALRKLKELGGTWTDIAKELDKFTTRNSSSSGDKLEYFKHLGEQIRQFSKDQGVDLEQGSFGKEKLGITDQHPTPPATPPAEGKIGQGPGARTGTTTAEAAESVEGTGLKNAIGEVERVSYGLPEATPTQRRAMGTAWIQAAKVLNDNPKAGEMLVTKLRNDPHMGLTDVDSAVLLRHKVGIENEMNAAAERTNLAEDPAVKANAQAEYQLLSDQLLELLDMAKARGSEWGREGRWRQAIANQDYSLATMEARQRASLGGRRLNESEHAQLQKDFNELQATQKAYEERLKQHESKVEELHLKLAQEKAARAEAGEAPAIHPTIIKIASDIVSKLDDAANRARERIKERMSRMSAGLDPTVVLDLAEIGASHLAHKILDFAKWSDRMRGEFGDWVEQYLEPVFKASQKKLEDLAVQHGKEKAPAVKRALREPTTAEIGEKVATAVADRLSNKENSAVSGYLQKLARALWKDGVRDRDEIVQKMHEIISRKIPDITPREVSRMWSGYGDYRQLTKDEISVGLRKLKGELLETHKLEDMAEGRPPLKSGQERGEVSEARRQLIKKVNDAKYTFQVPIEDPNTQLKSALDTYKTTLANRIADMEDRMARGDFAPRPRRELILDDAAMDLKAKNLRVRQRYEQELEKNRLAQRKPWQKLLWNFVRWERAMKLSSPVVFGKLGAAAATRLATTTAEEFVGAGLSKVPGISTIAKRAPREGGISLEGMSRGLAKMVTEGIQDAKDTAKSGMTNLDIVLGKEGGLDREWVNMFGQLHGMMKAPIKRFEYELSLQKRIESAMKNGEDVRDRQVMMRLMTEAMNDGYRSIFMQKGFTADLFNTALHMAETSKKYQPQGEIFARTMRFLLPIVRVPINIVAETATGITGVPVASARVMFHAINGSLKNMDPKVADSIMRQFKKGSIGAGLMAIGFMNPENIGGYDWREKRGANAPKAGGFQIFGMNVPRWLTHAPWFELMQFGATLRHAANNPKKGLSEGALAASVGLLEQTPFYGEMMRVTQAGESGKRAVVFFGDLAKSTVVPQAIQKIAEWTDAGKKRKPKSSNPFVFIGQNVMMGIPGLRQQVPEDYGKQPKW